MDGDPRDPEKLMGIRGVSAENLRPYAREGSNPNEAGTAAAAPPEQAAVTRRKRPIELRERRQLDRVDPGSIQRGLDRAEIRRILRRRPREHQTGGEADRR